MKSSTSQHRRIVLAAALAAAITMSGAQPSPPENSVNGSEYPYAKFSPSMAIIVVVLIAAFFFMGFFSIYIRHCSDTPAGSVRRALSRRSRRAAAARGLDPSVIETFPTFSYSEVKDHKIGKGELECAVCLNEFEEIETLRLLPKCDHVFHPTCIDTWLESHVTCPVCRANLDPLCEDDPVQTLSEPIRLNDDVERSHLDSNEIAVQVDGNEPGGSVRINRSSSLENPNLPPRSWSIKPRVLGFGKFRSHSTGHSLVQPGQNLDRFTLRLPQGVRKEVVDRAALNRTGSCAAALPRVESSRRGYRTGGGGEGSSWGRFYRRIEGLDLGAKSDRWVFFTRGLSMRSPKVVSEGGGEGSGSGGGGPVKLPSFKCLEPKAVDEIGLISDERSRNPV